MDDSSIFVIGAIGPERAWWPDHAVERETIHARRGAAIAGALVERAPSGARPASRTFVPVLRADGGISFARALWSSDRARAAGSEDAKADAPGTTTPTTTTPSATTPSTTTPTTTTPTTTTPTTTTPSLFVYGSLRPGRAAADRLQAHATRHEPATTRGSLFDLGDYPGWAPRGEGVVHGELVHVTELADVLRDLDAYEDFHGYTPAALERSLYHRVLTRVTLEHGREEVWAWAYAWNGHGEHPIVVGGSWDR